MPPFEVVFKGSQADPYFQTASCVLLWLVPARLSNVLRSPCTNLLCIHD